jgi:hypothetical protein
LLGAAESVRAHARLHRFVEYARVAYTALEIREFPDPTPAEDPMSQIDTEDLRFTPKAMEIIRKAESELRTKVYIAILKKLKSEGRNEVTPDDVHYALAKALEQMAAVAADM